MVGASAVMAVVFLLPSLASRLDKTGVLAFLASVDAPVAEQRKTKEELVAEAMEKSSGIKALYMTADVANDPGAGAVGLRKNIIRLAEETEINGIVIDVKEVCGPDYHEQALKKLLRELREKNIWAIARVAAFKDASQREAHPEWYLTRAASKKVSDWCLRKRRLTARGSALQESGKILWQDDKGGYWLDPASDGAREYLASFAKKIIDLGFDELQFDYIRFPSDGDVAAAQYPVYDGKTLKYGVMKSFFEYLSKELKTHKSDIILSADLFGYVAVQGGDDTIGQRLADIGGSFDYVSFMVYPSHYYNGVQFPADPVRDFAAVNFSFAEARAHPDITVGRSLQIAYDFLNPAPASSTVAVAGSPPLSSSRARLRPWLEDFFHEADRVADRPWGATKVRLEIDAAEKVEDHGWMLWNASNVYTEDALKKDATGADK